MLGVLKLRSGTTEGTAQIDEVRRIQWFATLIALVAPGSGGVTVRAGALNIAVWQEALALRAKGL